MASALLRAMKAAIHGGSEQRRMTDTFDHFEWRPDVASFPAPKKSLFMSTAINVIPDVDGYGPSPSLSIFNASPSSTTSAKARSGRAFHDAGASTVTSSIYTSGSGNESVPTNATSVTITCYGVGGDGGANFPNGGAPQTNTYNSGSGNETVPVGAVSVVIKVWGGGGGGSGGNKGPSGDGGDGGGGGAYVEYASDVDPSEWGDLLAYSVGAGGAGGAGQVFIPPSGPEAGANGGDSTSSGTLDSTAFSLSSPGGDGATLTSPGAGAGGTPAAGGDTNTDGGAGAENSGSVGGNGGAAPSGGSGGTGSGADGAGPGGGGAGGGGGNGVASSGGGGGDGGAGRITFEWTFGTGAAGGGGGGGALCVYTSAVAMGDWGQNVAYAFSGTAQTASGTLNSTGFSLSAGDGADGTDATDGVAGSGGAGGSASGGDTNTSGSAGSGAVGGDAPSGGFGGGVGESATTGVATDGFAPGGGGGGVSGSYSGVGTPGSGGAGLIQFDWTLSTAQQIPFFRIFIGDRTKLYEVLSNGDIDDLTRTSGGAYGMTELDRWTFSRFGQNILAHNVSDSVQVFDLASDTDFSNLSGSPPSSRFGAPYGNQHVLFNQGAGAAARTATASEIDDITSWLGDGTNGSWEIILPDGGPIHAGFEAGGGFWLGQANTWRRVLFVGDAAEVDLEVAVPSGGVTYPYSFAQHNGVAFYVSDSGFKQYLPGTGLPIDIGFGKVDKFFTSDSTHKFARTLGGGTILGHYFMHAAVDPVRKLYMLAYPTAAAVTLGDNWYLPDRIMVYHWPTEKWALFNVSADNLCCLIDAFLLDPVLGGQFVDWTRATGAIVVASGAPTSSLYATFTGSNMAATLETGDYQSFPDNAAHIKEAAPLIDAATASDVSVQVGYRARLGDAVSYAAAEALNTLGEAHPNRYARYPRLRTVVAAGASWTRSRGIECVWTSGGRRK